MSRAALGVHGLAMPTGSAGDGQGEAVGLSVTADASRRASAFPVVVLVLLPAARMSSVLFFGQAGQVAFMVALFVVPLLYAVPATGRWCGAGAGLAPRVCGWSVDPLAGRPTHKQERPISRAAGIGGERRCHAEDRGRLMMSVDGVVEAPETWTGPYFSPQLGQHVGSLMGEGDTTLLGRVTYQTFAASFAGNPSDPRAAQAPAGKNINISGSATLVAWLLRQGLLDELDLLVFPVVVGHGKQLFNADGSTVGLSLAVCDSFPRRRGAPGLPPRQRLRHGGCHGAPAGAATEPARTRKGPCHDYVTFGHPPPGQPRRAG